MKSLEEIFNTNESGEITKWNHYFEIYERHLSRYRNKVVSILEIGVYQGGSLRMWREYFGDKCQVYGVDINPECKTLEDENISIFIGDQNDKSFLNELKEKIPKIDILIDDGGHTMDQLRTTFNELFDFIDENGIYIAEDLHTSYFPNYEFGGGYKSKKSFIELSKDLIDYLNAFHSRNKKLKVNNYTKKINSIHYYDSVLVIEKKIRDKPFIVKKGKKIVSQYPGQKMNFRMRLKRKLDYLRRK